MGTYQITKDADKMICCIYKSYLERRKNGESKSLAKRFENNYFASDSNLSKWQSEDISETLLELAHSQLVNIYIGGDFNITDQAIIYMENRFKNGLSEILDIISKMF